MVLLGVASGHLGSEVRFPETRSVQGVPGGGMRWVNMANSIVLLSLPNPLLKILLGILILSHPFCSGHEFTESLLESSTKANNCAHFIDVEIAAQEGEVAYLGNDLARIPKWLPGACPACMRVPYTCPCREHVC